MFGLGMGELLVILVIVVLVFGAGKLPEVGNSLGKAIRNFKHSASGSDEIEVSKKKEITGGSDHDAVDADVVDSKASKKRT